MPWMTLLGVWVVVSFPAAVLVSRVLAGRRRPTAEPTPRETVMRVHWPDDRVPSRASDRVLTSAR